MWKELKLPITSLPHFFEDQIMYQMKKIVRTLADKGEYHIKRAHQDSKRNERIYCELKTFQQSQILKLKNNDMNNINVKGNVIFEI